MGVQCAGCDTEWTGLGKCHCGARECHRTFSGVTLFDLHRSRGKCVDPATLRTKDGKPLAFLVLGIWQTTPNEPTRGDSLREWREQKKIQNVTGGKL